MRDCFRFFLIQCLFFKICYYPFHIIMTFDYLFIYYRRASYTAVEFSDVCLYAHLTDRIEIVCAMRFFAVVIFYAAFFLNSIAHFPCMRTQLTRAFLLVLNHFYSRCITLETYVCAAVPPTALLREVVQWMGCFHSVGECGTVILWMRSLWTWNTIQECGRQPHSF